MNSSIALRLLWKEYRVQRGLWLAMAAGSVMLQALIAFLMPSGPERFQGIVPVAFMLTGFYAIGSGAITFAIEREDGTQLRPVMLGCPPGLTLTVKTLFGIVTTALLLALTISSGMLLSLGNLTLPENTFPTEASGMLIPLALLFVALPYLGCLLWSTLFSLITRKVIVALGLAAVAMIGSYIVVAMTSIAMIESWQRHPSYQPRGMELFIAAIIPCFLVLLLLAANYLLTHRWLTRVFFDQTSARSPSFFKCWRIRRSGLDGGMIVEIGVEDRTAFEVISPEVAVHQPPPRFGLSLLYATWGPNLWRHLRFLRWREAIETRKLFVGFLLVTLVLTYWCVAVNFRGIGTEWHGLVAFFIHAACVACGVMAFRAEQDDRKVQRLADMGLRPATVWFSKHLVWLSRAVISVAAILLCATIAAELFYTSRSVVRVEQFMEGVWLNQQIPNSIPSHYPGLRLVGRAIILTLTMYGIGQVCSQLIRSTIVSMFVSFVLGLTAFGWAAACWWFGVPFILSVLPLAIGCFLVTWFRTGSWMLDDNRGRAWVWPTAAITVAIAVVYVATGLFRVYQIPWSEPFFADANSPSAEGHDGLTAEQRATVLAPVSEAERRTFELYQRASDLMGKTDLRQSDVVTDQERWAAFSEEEQLAAEKAIRLVLEAAESPVCADYSPATTNIADNYTSLAYGKFENASELILFDARRKIEAGNLQMTLDRFRSAFAVCRHTAGRGGDTNWSFSHTLTQRTISELQKWARHPNVDKTLVEEAVTIIDEHRAKMVPIEVANFAMAVMYRDTLDVDAFTLGELTSGSNRLPIMLASKFPGERARSLRLLNTWESHDVETMAAYRSQQAVAKAGNGTGMANWLRDRRSVNSQQEQFFRSLAVSTPLFAMLQSATTGDQLCQSDIRTEFEFHATKLLMRLLQQQRSGELPATLDDFDASLNDPWTDKPFIWYPEGLPGDLKEGSDVRVEANTPFFMSFRTSQATIQRVELWKPDEEFNALNEDQLQTADGAAMTSALTANRQPPSVPADTNQPDFGQSAPGGARVMDRASGKTVVEYVFDNGQEFSVPNVRIWQLPKTAGMTAEASE
ncbi:MAG: hypothetical protein HQ518_07560 [Rhodopirellula sp.]|nr:hypothetical protein [Rhodopirellula sp.]